MVPPRTGPYCARARTSSLSASAGRSSYPQIDNLCETATPSSTATLDSAFCFLPQEISISTTIDLKSSVTPVFIDDDEQHNHLQRDPPTLKADAAAAPTGTSSEPTAAGSRKSSASSFTSSVSQSSFSDVTSPPSSLASSQAFEQLDSHASSTSNTPARRKAKFWLDAGEDPGLEAARRALWEDFDDLKLCASPEVNVQAAPLSAQTSSTSNTSTPLASDSNGMRIQEGPETPQLEQDDGEGEESDGDDEYEEDEEVAMVEEIEVLLPPLASPSRPAHTTLSPLPSCLRPPLGSRTVSASSFTSSNTPSVQFLEERSISLTYSPTDYERKGDDPVEKLSIKEWVELKSVREAVGLFSGYIEPWHDNLPPPPPPSAHGSRCPSPAPRPSSQSLETPLSPRKACAPLAGASGVLSVGVLSSHPIERPAY
ncbi:hypothetical protein T439DRAFT_320404 [Meredithblackwellia eburnea MCA 4105]